MTPLPTLTACCKATWKWTETQVAELLDAATSGGKHDVASLLWLDNKAIPGNVEHVQKLATAIALGLAKCNDETLSDEMKDEIDKILATSDFLGEAGIVVTVKQARDKMAFKGKTKTPGAPAERALRLLSGNGAHSLAGVRVGAKKGLAAYAKERQAQVETTIATAAAKDVATALAAAEVAKRESKVLDAERLRLLEAGRSLEQEAKQQLSAKDQEILDRDERIRELEAVLQQQQRQVPQAGTLEQVNRKFNLSQGVVDAGEFDNQSECEFSDSD